MRVVSWNMNKRSSGNWEWVIDNLDPDYVLAQEASPLPPNVKATTRTTTKKSNRSAFYSKTGDHEKLKMSNDHGMGVLVTKRNDLFFICVYANLDFKPVHLALLGILAKSVSNIRRRHDAENIIIAGDFNMDRRMDDNPTGTVFAAKDTYPTNEFFDAILDMGFHEGMRKFSSDPVQTHHNAKSEFPWELDHIFMTKELYDRLRNIETIEVPELSDHDPIVADFR